MQPAEIAAYAAVASAITAVILTIATVVYAVLTWKAVKAARDSALAARDGARDARKSTEAARDSARAAEQSAAHAARAADAAERALIVENMPQLITIRDPTSNHEGDFVVRNVGRLAALNGQAFYIAATRNLNEDYEHRLPAIVVDGEVSLELKVHGRGSGDSFEHRVTLVYEDAAGVRYRTLCYHYHYQRADEWEFQVEHNGEWRGLRPPTAALSQRSRQ